jgi:hypothetical protein
MSAESPVVMEEKFQDAPESEFPRNALAHSIEQHSGRVRNGADSTESSIECYSNAVQQYGSPFKWASAAPTAISINSFNLNQPSIKIVEYHESS